MISFLHQQPFKTLYLAYEFITVSFIRLPYWVLVSLPRSWRGRPSWSFKQALFSRVMAHITSFSWRIVGPITSPSYRALESGSNGVWIEPVSDMMVIGDVAIWARTAGVFPIRIPGYWIHQKGTTIEAGASPMPGEKVVLHLHGGAYTLSSAHPSSPITTICKGLIEYVDTVHRVFAVEYRLTVREPYPEAHPFPTALIDALAGYTYLVKTVGFSPNDIIVEGDSAGGNLAHALVRYLVENHQDKADIPAPPGMLILLSPWCDLSRKPTKVLPTSSTVTCYHTDILRNLYGGGTYLSAKAFLGPLGWGGAERVRYISPASLHPSLGNISFKGFPRTFIVSGDAEVLLDQIRILSDRMVKQMGEGDGEGQVRYYEAKDAWHDYLVTSGSSESQRRETLTAIAKWIQAV